MKTKKFFSVAIASLLLFGSVLASEKVSVNDNNKEVKLNTAPAALVEILKKVNFSEGDVKIYFRVEAEDRLIIYKLESDNSELTSAIKSKLKYAKIDAKGYAPGLYIFNAKFYDPSNTSDLVANK
jgi:hypothetical protein